ncbi:hypothetical protein [Thalassotalea fusca]
MAVLINHITSSGWHSVNASAPTRANTSTPSPDSNRYKDTVFLSTLGQQKLAEENHSNIPEKDTLDRLIDTIKEKIKKLKAELKKLASNNSEQAKYQRALLHQEIAMQNVMLMELLGKKLGSLN